MVRVVEAVVDNLNKTEQVCLPSDTIFLQRWQEGTGDRLFTRQINDYLLCTECFVVPATV